ncbi:MAG: hypothetical protein WD846_00255 [Patescibacteria group bacterium]
MERNFQLNTTPRRILAAALLSGGIVFAVSTFAQTSYVQTQKVQLESAEGRHCEEWTYVRTNGEITVDCERWAAEEG